MRSSEAGCCRDTASLTSHVVVRGRRVKRGFRSERMLTLAELKERPPGGKKLKGGKYQRSCLHDDITVRTAASHMSAGPRLLSLSVLPLA